MDMPLGFVHMARSRLLKKSTQKKLLRTWGYILIPVIFWAWYTHYLGYGAIAILSALAALFFLFQARVPCGALNRDGQTHCIHNGKGLLGGCNQVVAHKWYNAKMLVSRSTWGRFVSNAFRKLYGGAAFLGAMATVMSAFISAGALLVSTFAYLDPRAPK
jgi:hypothetical protein